MSEDIGLTPAQRGEVIELLRGYFGSEEADRRAEQAAKDMVALQFDQGMKAKIAACVVADPEKVIYQLFRDSGHVVKTKSSETFDAIVNDLLRDEESGLPDAIRGYAREHFAELIQRAVTEIIAAMFVDFVKGEAMAGVNASRELIARAFMNSNVQTRW